MARFIARRLLWMIALLFAVSFITFIVFYLLPTADPAALRAGRQPNPELVEKIRERLGLNDPWYVQYFNYMKDLVLHLDFGYSYQSDISVREQLFDRLPATISLAAGAAVIAVITGVAVGAVSAVRRRSWVDRISMGFALVAVSAPVYWLGLVMLYLLAKDIGKVGIFEGTGAYTPLTEDPAGWLGSLLLPWIVLAVTFTAIYARLLRGSLIETMGEDYIRTARAKGLRERRIVLRHGVRSAITPLVTAAGVDIGILLGGAILTESVFDIPGIGLLAYDSIENSDLPMIQGTVLFGAFFIVLASLVVDVLYAFLDPRVTYD